MKTVLIGVDPSSVKLAATIGTPGDEPHVVQRKATLPRDKPKGCTTAFDWMTDLCVEYGGEDIVLYVFIESPVLGRGGPGSTIPQAQINGALLAAAFKAGAKVHAVNNAHCKKDVVGKGNAKKEDVAAWCKESWPYVYKMCDRDQDLIDSAMIWVFGRKVLQMHQRLETKRRRSMSRTRHKMEKTA